MKDLNFFDTYIEKKDFNDYKQWITFTIFGLILLALTSKGMVNHIKIKRLNKEVNRLKVIVENPETISRVNSIREKEEETHVFKEELNKIKLLDELIEEEDIISGDFLYLISSRLPEDTFLTSLSVSSKEMNLVGIAQNTWSVAEFGKGLEYIKEVDEIFISDIGRESDFYHFNINVFLKGEVTDGE